MSRKLFTQMQSIKDSMVLEAKKKSIEAVIESPEHIALREECKNTLLKLVHMTLYPNDEELKDDGILERLESQCKELNRMNEGGIRE